MKFGGALNCRNGFLVVHPVVEVPEGRLPGAVFRVEGQADAGEGAVRCRRWCSPHAGAADLVDHGEGVVGAVDGPRTTNSRRPRRSSRRCRYAWPQQRAMLQQPVAGAVAEGVIDVALNRRCRQSRDHQALPALFARASAVAQAVVEEARRLGRLVESSYWSGRKAAGPSAGRVRWRWRHGPTRSGGSRSRPNTWAPGGI